MSPNEAGIVRYSHYGHTGGATVTPTARVPVGSRWPTGPLKVPGYPRTSAVDTRIGQAFRMPISSDVRRSRLTRESHTRRRIGFSMRTGRIRRLTLPSGRLDHSFREPDSGAVIGLCA